MPLTIIMLVLTVTSRGKRVVNMSSVEDDIADFACDCGRCTDCNIAYETGYYPHEIKGLYNKGIEDVIAIIEERGKRIGGAIDPKRTVDEIRKRLVK
jgi:hypothetical protein